MLTLVIVLALAAQRPRIDTTLVQLPGEDGPTWEVTLDARGLDRDAPPVLHLQDWGEWTQASGYAELVESEPALIGQGPRWSLADPSRWRGRLSARLRLRPVRFGSDEHGRHGLLPIWSETYTFGFAWNVVPNLEGPDGPVEAARHLTLRAGEGQQVITGWAGRGPGDQRVELERRQGNALIAFGTPGHVASSAALEVYQFGGTYAVARRVHDLVAALLPSMSAACGRPATRPLIVMVTDTNGGGTGSDHGLRVGFTREAGQGHAASPYFHQLIAHELFHQWLGGMLHPADDSLVWFQEGFTDYLALWHLAASGGVDRDWFVERLGELDAEARTRSSLGRVSFADPQVRWRDGDGPNETMAYKGGAVLALALDAELRAQGRPGLHALLRHLLEQGSTYEAGAVRAWLRANGLAQLDARAIAGTDVPTVDDSLRRAGFEPRQRPTLLTWTGLRTDAEPLGTVLDVAPDSPASRAGLAVGDVVTGCCHIRGGRPVLGEEVELDHRYGLTWFDPGRRDHRIWVTRAGAQLELALVPDLVAGGVLRTWSTAGEAADAFFRQD